MNTILNDLKTVEQIDEVRLKVYGEDFIKPCNEEQILANMDKIIRAVLG